MGLLFGWLLLSLLAVEGPHVNAYFTGPERYRGEDMLVIPSDPEKYGYPVEQAFPGGGPAGPKKPILSPVRRDYALGGTVGPLKPIPMLVEPGYPMREPLASTKPVSWTVEPNYPQWEPMDQMKPAPLPVKLKYPTLGSAGLSNPQTDHPVPRHPLPVYVDSHRGPKMIPDHFVTSETPRKPVYKAKRPSDLLKYPRKPRYLTIRTRYVPKHPAWRKKSRWDHSLCLLDQFRLNEDLKLSGPAPTEVMDFIANMHTFEAIKY